tara:strand:+ start:8841 stop:9830 length:990 start_codon:yes stop_codon:yes gene_type:complete
LKNINKISYQSIKNLFIENNIVFSSDFNDDDFFNSFNSISNSKENDLTFLTNPSFKNKISNTKAKGCLILKENINYLPKHTNPIIVDDVYKSFALLTNLFVKEEKSNGLISHLANINENSILHTNLQIDCFVSIRENTEISNNAIIESNCSIGPNVYIGENTIIRSNSTISHSHIGNNCVIKSGAVIGGTGFGFDTSSKTRIQHNGNVIIGNNCSIGSNTTIDRAVFDSTIISSNSFIDNLVHIAHNVSIGKGAIIAAQTGIAGSTLIGNHVSIGGQSGIAGHINIGNNVKIAAKSGITKNIEDNSIVAGFPAIDIKKWKLNNIKLNNL